MLASTGFPPPILGTTPPDSPTSTNSNPSRSTNYFEFPITNRSRSNSKNTATLSDHVSSNSNEKSSANTSTSSPKNTSILAGSSGISLSYDSIVAANPFLTATAASVSSIFGGNKPDPNHDPYS